MQVVEKNITIVFLAAMGMAALRMAARPGNYLLCRQMAVPLKI